MTAIAMPAYFIEFVTVTEVHMHIKSQNMPLKWHVVTQQLLLDVVLHAVTSVALDCKTVMAQKAATKALPSIIITTGSVQGTKT